MEINRYNFEAFLLDRLEGRLSEAEKRRLDEFLLQNPDCALGVLEEDPWKLEAETVHFHDKRQLKKEIPGESSPQSDHNFDLFSIARMEGDLNADQEETHRLMVEADDQKHAQWMAWQKTKLIPEQVPFEKKGSLYQKKGQMRRIIWMSVISSAAALALVLVLFRMGPLEPQTELSQELPVNTEVKMDQESTGQPGLTENPDLTVPVKVEEPVKKATGKQMFSVKKERERPADSGPKEPLVPRDDLQPRSLRISENKLNTSTLTGEVVPDRIEALEIPPVATHLSSLSIAQLYDMDLEEVLNEYAEERNFSLWTIADAGIKGINKIAGSNISLLASRDDEGEVSGFRLKSKRFSITRPLTREE